MAKTKNINEVDDILASLNTDDNIEVFKNTDEGEVKDWIPTLIPKFDYNLIGGIPASGQVSEVFGKPSSGKSTLTGLLIRNAQRMGIIIVYYDVEGTQSNSRLEELGVDTTKLLKMTNKRLKDGTIRPMSIEGVAEKIIDISARVHATDSDRLVFHIWDSIAITQSDMQADADLDQALVGQQAKALATIGRKLQVNLIENNGFLLALNQARDDFGAANARYATQKTVGGKGWLHLLSTQISFQASKKITPNSSETQAIGNKTMVKVPKSKIGDNYDSKFFIDLIGKWGYDIEYNLVDDAQELGLISTGKNPRYVSDNGEEIKGSNVLNLVMKFKKPESSDIKRELWQKEIKNYFPNCYLPLFNTTAVMLESQFPLIKGLRKYYMDIQASLPEREQAFNYKHFIKEYNKGKLPMGLQEEVASYE